MEKEVNETKLKLTVAIITLALSCGIVSYNHNRIHNENIKESINKAYLSMNIEELKQLKTIVDSKINIYDDVKNCKIK